MYLLGKRVISQFIRTGCRRRLRLDLYKGSADRARGDAPEKDASRPGLTLLAEQGRQYEREKYQELETVFPSLVVHGTPKAFEVGERCVFQPLHLSDHIDALVPQQFLLEAQFDITASFREAHNLRDLENGSATADGERLVFEDVRPDILQVKPPTNVTRRIITPSGQIERIGSEDTRLGLRVIDIKISGEPSPAHFSELAYYGMALAGWLHDTGRSARFVVLAEAAIWPGCHTGSTIHQLDVEDRANRVVHRDLNRYLEGLETDLQVMPPEVVIGRVQRFLKVDLREVLAVADWKTLPWHVDHRCSGCDYLGYRWQRHDSEATELAETTEPRPDPLDQRYCWPMAEKLGHLSRLTGMTEGATGKLAEASITTVAAVSEMSAGSSAFEKHQHLRAKRTVLRERAVTLIENRAAWIPDRAGTSAVLPRFADIKIAVSADFDVGSGLTFAFGYRINYGVPTAHRQAQAGGARYDRTFRTIERPLLVLQRSLESEGETLRLWLQHLVSDIQRARQEILKGYRAHGAPDRRDATLQFYIWDRLTFDHLCRVFSRHLDRLEPPVRMGDQDVSPMAWVFPADQVLEEPEFVGRASPISIVADAVNSLMAAAIPHHYGLIELANAIEPESRVVQGRRWAFHVNKFYRDPLSDQIPSERGHEVWEATSPFADRDYQWHQDMMRQVVKRKLHAIAYVAEKLTHWLADELSAQAPAVGSVFDLSDRLTGVGHDGQIIYQHSSLMAAAERLESELLMAMPPHEREARFRSARVEQWLIKDDRRQALEALGLADRAVDSRVLVFRLSHRSRDARLKEGEFSWSFFPEADLRSLQELTVAQFKAHYPVLKARLPTQNWEYRERLRHRLNVTILRIDRANCLLVIEAGDLLHHALQANLLQMDLDGARGRFAILDPIPLDFFTRKLRKALSDVTGIRNPPIASARPLFPNATVARVRQGQARTTQSRPAAEFIWNADVLAATTSGVPTAPILAVAERVLPGITERQREAILAAVDRRLALWWGPPGTGKSRTAQAYLVGTAVHALQAQQGLSIAIVGSTWVAIDNVARRLPQLFDREGIAAHVQLVRLHSAGLPTGVPSELHDHILPLDDDSRRRELEERLLARQGVTIVASTADQLSKLGGDDVCAPLFDVMLVDEASQLDVAHAIVAFTKLAHAARVTVVGDDKQMAPIHPLEAPVGVEHLLGSIYDFYRQYRKNEGAQFAIRPVMLNRSFRSNKEIIEFVREAGYDEDLDAAPKNAQLRIRTAGPYPTAKPTDWPEEVSWSPHYREILDPEHPLAAVVHHDRYSSQRNDEEADLVAGLVLSLYRAGLSDLLGADAQEVYSPKDFFVHGVGIVTPHRAQQAAVFERLSQIMPPEIDRNVIFASIDTVERFQGQEKALMIASFGLGDVDQIAAEEEFLYSLNRFNVTASRAQAKFIAIVSRQLIDHLPRDRRALEESRLLKHFVDGFLRRVHRIALPSLGQCELHTR